MTGDRIRNTKHQARYKRVWPYRKTNSLDISDSGEVTASGRAQANNPAK